MNYFSNYIKLQKIDKTRFVVSIALLYIIASGFAISNVTKLEYVVLIILLPLLILFITYSLTGNKLRIVIVALLLRSSLDIFTYIQIAGINIAGLFAISVLFMTLFIFTVEGYANIIFTYRSILILSLVVSGVIGAISGVANFGFSEIAVKSLSEFSRLLSIAAIFWLTTAFVREWRNIHHILKAIVISSIIPLSFGFFELIFGFDSSIVLGTDIKRIKSVFGHPNNYAHYLLFIYIVSYVYQNIFKKKAGLNWVRIIHAAVILSLILTFSRSAIFGLVLARFLLNWGIKGRSIKFWVINALLVLGIWMIYPLFLELTFSTTLVSNNPSLSTLASRLFLWQRGISILVNNDMGFLGNGPGSFSHLVGLIAHNDYLRVLFEYGVLGLLLFLAIIFVQFFDGWHLLKNSLKITKDRDIRNTIPSFKATSVNRVILARGFLALVISFTLISFFANVFNYPVLQWYIFAYWGIVVSLNEDLDLSCE